MRALLHAIWPFLAVVGFTTFLALQIPRKALFFMPCAECPRKEALAAFVSFDAVTQERLVRETRMSWQVRSARLAGREGPTLQLGLDEPLPPHVALPLPGSFTTGTVREESALEPVAALLPPSQGRTIVLLPSGDDAEIQAAARTALRADMLALPASLDETAF